jgi:hypothetical protein
MKTSYLTGHLRFFRSDILHPFNSFAVHHTEILYTSYNVLDNICSQCVFNLHGDLVCFPRGLYSCIERQSQIRKLKSTDCAIMKCNYYGNLDFANILWASMKYSSCFRSFISNLFWHCFLGGHLLF